MFDLVQTVRLGERIGFIPRELNKPPHDRPLLASDEPLDHIGKLLMPAKRCLRSKELSVGREKVGTYLPIAALKLSGHMSDYVLIGRGPTCSVGHAMVRRAVRLIPSREALEVAQVPLLWTLSLAATGDVRVVR